MIEVAKMLNYYIGYPSNESMHTIGIVHRKCSDCVHDTGCTIPTAIAGPRPVNSVATLL